MNIYFDSLTDFIAMGGHGAYVWFCYLVVFFALIIQTGLIKLNFKNVKKRLRRYYEKLNQSNL